MNEKLVLVGIHEEGKSWVRAQITRNCEGGTAVVKQVEGLSARSSILVIVVQ